MKADAIAAVAGMAYFQDNRQLIKGVLDDTIEQIRQLGDRPAEEVFSSLLLTFKADPDRGATVAAAAVMRLAWPGGAL